MRNGITKRKKQVLSVLIPFLLIIILMCIPYTNDVFIGVFGYAVYAYMIIGAALSVFYLLNKRIALPKKQIAVYVAFFFCFLITLHIGLGKSLIEKGNFALYIIEPYTRDTVGGMIMSIVTSIIVVPIGYTGALLLFFILSAVLLFVSIFPLLIKKNGDGKRAWLVDKTDNASQKNSSDGGLEIYTTEQQNKPIAPEDFEETPKPKNLIDSIKIKDKPTIDSLGEPTVFPNIKETISDGDYERYTNNYRRKKAQEEAYRLLFDKTAPAEKETIDANKPAPNTYSYTPYTPTQNVDNTVTAKAQTDSERASNTYYAKNNAFTATAKVEEKPKSNTFTPTAKVEEMPKSNTFAANTMGSSNVSAAKSDARNGNFSTTYNVGDVFMPRQASDGSDDSIYDLARKTRNGMMKSDSAEKTLDVVEDKPFEQVKQLENDEQLHNIDEVVCTATIEPSVNTNESEVTSAESREFDEKVEEQKVEAVNNENVLTNDFKADEYTPKEPFTYVAPTITQSKITEIAEKHFDSDDDVSERAELPHKVENANKSEHEKGLPKRSSPLDNLVQTQIKLDEEKQPQKEEVQAEKKAEVPVKPPKPYVAPHLGLLADHTEPNFSREITEEEFNHNKETIESTLQSFGINVEVVSATKGPVITRYELVLRSGSINRVLSLKMDLTMRLSSKGAVDIIAPIEGKDAIGVDIPNGVKNNVSFRDVIACRAFQKDTSGLKIALGEQIDGSPYVVDLEAMPHLLVAGATGKGKSVCTNVIITSLLFQHSPDEVKFVLIDPKLVEMVHYAYMPHMLIPEPLDDIPTIVRALRWVEAETYRRYEHFRAIKKLTINAYNEYARANGLRPKYKIVVVIDEASQLMSKAKKETEEVLSSLARIGRAAGVHLIFATQSPTKDVITSEIQNNLTTKIAFAVNDYIHSQVIFKAKGAENLLGRGDMLIRGDGGKMTRIQCSFLDPDEKEKVISFISKNNESDFDEDIYNAIYKVKEAAPEEEESGRKSTIGAGEKTPDLDEVKAALMIGFRNGGISTSLLQRKMGKGFNSAARIVDYLTDNQLIDEGEPGTNKKRKIRISMDEFLDAFPDERLLVKPEGDRGDEDGEVE